MNRGDDIGRGENILLDVGFLAPRSLGPLEQGGGEHHPYLGHALGNHQGQFGPATGLLTSGRGMASAANERFAKEAGVEDTVLAPLGNAPPERWAEERCRRFKWGYRFRAGIEGRIYALQRDYTPKRCLYLREQGFGRAVRWVILARYLS
jgi:IS5 family transposase